MNCLRYWAKYMRKEKVKNRGIKNGNGPFHSSETPYLTINCVTPSHHINIQQLIS